MCISRGESVNSVDIAHFALRSIQVTYVCSTYNGTVVSVRPNATFQQVQLVNFYSTLVFERLVG